MSRIPIILLSIASGVAASMAVIALMMPDVPHPPNVPFRTTPEEDRVIFEGCLVFFAVAYATARTLYRLVGAEDGALAVADTASQHMPVLHVLASAMLIVIALPTVWGGHARLRDWLTLGLGGILLPMAVRDLLEALRRHRPFGLNFGSPRRGRPEC
ncbi:hypothetical protein [Tautonia rosea]|uniref:hypothetical protein n=1 Tax=Tautonia rosea TaxID=2728037 RepID=UPI001472D30A|nr:hypothetical protein [Tautonia rosea]